MRYCIYDGTALQFDSNHSATALTTRRFDLSNRHPQICSAQHSTSQHSTAPQSISAIHAYIYGALHAPLHHCTARRAPRAIAWSRRDGALRARTACAMHITLHARLDTSPRSAHYCSLHACDALLHGAAAVCSPGGRCARSARIHIPLNSSAFQCLVDADSISQSSLTAAAAAAAAPFDLLDSPPAFRLAGINANPSHDTYTMAY